MELLSFNFVDAVTVHSDFGAQGNKVCHCFHCFPIYLPWRDGTRCHDLCFSHWPSFLKALGTRIIWTPQHGAGVFLWPCSFPHPTLLHCCIFVKGLFLSWKLLTPGVVCSCLCVPTPWGQSPWHSLPLNECVHFNDIYTENSGKYGTNAQQHLCSYADSLLLRVQFLIQQGFVVVQSQVVSYSLWPHGLQHTRLPCPLISPGVCSNSCLSELVMPSNHLIFCHPLLFLASIFPSIRGFCNESVFSSESAGIKLHQCICCSNFYFFPLVLLFCLCSDEHF